MGSTDTAHRKRRRIRRLATGVILALALLPLFAAFEAHVVNVRAHIENALHVDPAEVDFGIVFPQEQLSEEFSVRLSDSFMEQERVTDVFYRLVLDRKPKTHGGTELYADLRPYVEVTKTVEFDPDGLAFADLGNFWLPPDGAPETRDIEDRWVIDFAVPCIQGAVGQDYEGPIAPAEDDYGMDIRVEVLGLSYGDRLYKIPVGPRVVTTKTRVEWTFFVVVKNTSGQTMHDVVITDHFGAELDCLDDYEVTYACSSPAWIFEQYTNPSGRQDRIRWTVNELAPWDRGILVLTVATKTNPAGKQEYTSPGVYTLNSGAVLKWKGDAGVQHSESTEPISVTAVSP